MSEFEKYARKHCGISSLKLHDFQSVSGAYVSPTIIEERQLNIATMDVFSRLMMDRIIFLGAPIYDDAANIIQAQLLFLESVDPEKDIQIYINSPGGSVSAGLGIYDTMQLVNRPTWRPSARDWPLRWAPCCLRPGAKGKRSALPHSRVMIHQPLGGVAGTGLGHRNHGARRSCKHQDANCTRFCRPIRASRCQEDREGRRPRLLDDGARGQGVRPDRRGARRAQERSDRTSVFGNKGTFQAGTETPRITNPMGRKTTTKETDCCSFCGSPRAARSAIMFRGQRRRQHLQQVHRARTLAVVENERGFGARRQRSPKPIRLEELLKPADIKAFLDQYVIGQDEAKRHMAVAVYNHYKRLLHAPSERRARSRSTSRTSCWSARPVRARR